MRTWTRAVRGTICGYCAGIIAVHSPLQVVVLANITRARIRCATCADGPIPDDLPALPARRAPVVFIDEDGIERPVFQVKPMTQLTRGQSIPTDWKQKASGA